MLDTYSFTHAWTAQVEDSVKAWLTETYKQRENEEPDQEFLQFVMEMVKEGSTMGDIKKELMELGTDEATASSFVSEMEEMLRKIEAEDISQAQSTDVAPASAPTPSSQDSLLAKPLKSSRENGTKKRDSADNVIKPADGGARILTSALQSSRFPTKQNNPTRRDEREGDRERDRRRPEPVVEDHHSKRARGQYQPPSQEPAFVPPRPPVDPSNPVAYFEEMNRIARESGFKNAQEMLSSQKELMSMMQGGAPTLGVPGLPPHMGVPGGFYAGPPHHAPVPHGHPGYPGYPPHGYYPPAYAPMDHMGHQFSPRGGRGAGRFALRGGRGSGRFGGRYGEAPPLPAGPPPSSAGAPAPASTDDSTPAAADTQSAPALAPVPSPVPAPEGGRENPPSEAAPSSEAQSVDVPTGFPGRIPGRGRGRGGRGGRGGVALDASAPKPAAALNPFASSWSAGSANPFTTTAVSAVDPAVVAVADMGGRAAYGGRGRGRGRMAPLGHKTWVRPDLVAANPEQR